MNKDKLSDIVTAAHMHAVGARDSLDELGFNINNNRFLKFKTHIFMLIENLEKLKNGLKDK